MIVIGILVLMIGVSISGLNRMSSHQLRTQTNRLAAALRYTYNRSTTYGLYMRMVIDMDSNSYWVEASDRPVFLSTTKRTDPEDEKDKQKQKQEDNGEDDGKDAYGHARKSRRQKYVSDGVIEKISMSRGIGIAGVMTINQEEIFESGRAYIHFFPNGFVEPSMIYTTDGDDEYFTLTVSPMTGKVARKHGRVDPSREFGEPDRVEVESAR